MRALIIRKMARPRRILVVVTAALARALILQLESYVGIYGGRCVCSRGEGREVVNWREC